MLNGDRVSFWEDKKFLGMDGVNGCAQCHVLNATELDTEKMVKMVHFMLCIFYHQKKKIEKNKFVKHFFLSCNLFLRVTCLYLEVCSTPSFPVFHYHLEFAQTHVH